MFRWIEVEIRIQLHCPLLSEFIQSVIVVVLLTSCNLWPVACMFSRSRAMTAITRDHGDAFGSAVGYCL
jgi:hypothetical protein